MKEKKNILFLTMFLFITLSNGYILQNLAVPAIGSVNENHNNPTIIVEWNKTLGIEESAPTKVFLTEDGGFIVLANIYNKLSIYSWSIWIVKIDRSGNEIWNSVIPGILFENRESFLIESADGYQILGKFNSAIWAIKVDKFGEYQWNMSTNLFHTELFTNTTHEIRVEIMKKNVIQVRDGGFLFSTSKGRFEFVEGNFEEFSLTLEVTKVDHDLKMDWNLTLGGNDSIFVEKVLGLEHGGFIITDNLVLLKIDDNGDLNWRHNITNSINPNVGYHFVTSMDEIPNSGFLISTFSREHQNDVIGQICYINYNFLGEELWDICLDSSETGNNIIGEGVRRLNGGYLLAGTQNQTSIHNGTDIFLVGTDESGIIDWNFNIGAKNNQKFVDLINPNENEYIILGQTESEAEPNIYQSIIYKIFINDEKSNGTISGYLFLHFLIPIGCTVYFRNKTKF